MPTSALCSAASTPRSAALQRPRSGCQTPHRPTRAVPTCCCPTTATSRCTERRGICPMTRIDGGATGIAETIRRQLAALRDGTAAQRKDGPRAPAGESLAGIVARRVLAIDPGDPDRRRKAFRVFLESVLL